MSASQKRKRDEESDDDSGDETEEIEDKADIATMLSRVDAGENIREAKRRPNRKLQYEYSDTEEYEPASKDYIMFGNPEYDSNEPDEQNVEPFQITFQRCFQRMWGSLFSKK